jgi:hypothetical protein
MKSRMHKINKQWSVYLVRLCANPIFNLLAALICVHILHLNIKLIINEYWQRIRYGGYLIVRFPAEEFLSSPQHLDWLQGSPSLLSDGYRALISHRPRAQVSSLWLTPTGKVYLLSLCNNRRGSQNVPWILWHTRPFWEAAQCSSEEASWQVARRGSGFCTEPHITQPPHSPDLAVPCLKGTRLATMERIKWNARAGLLKIPTEAFQQWQDRWSHCVCVCVCVCVFMSPTLKAIR